MGGVGRALPARQGGAAAVRVGGVAAAAGEGRRDGKRREGKLVGGETKIFIIDQHATGKARPTAPGAGQTQIIGVRSRSRNHRHSHHD